MSRGEFGNAIATSNGYPGFSLGEIFEHVKTDLKRPMKLTLGENSTSDGWQFQKTACDPPGSDCGQTEQGPFTRPP